jgi:O-antigen/teichoic acid export membrane protein
MSPDLVGEASLNRRMMHGAAWMIAVRFADRAVGFVSTIILARLLVPGDFGLVALAMTMIAAAGIFGEFGFEMALIQNRKAERSHYDTAWSIGVLRGLATAVIITLVAEPLAAYFNDPRLDDVIMLLALVPILAGLCNIGTVAFRKDLTLNKEFVFRVVPRIVGAAVTVASAFIWQNYWALVSGTLTGSVVKLIISYVMQTYRPRISLAAWREIMGFSMWMMVTSITAFANQKVGTLIIAKHLDAAALGVFSIANEISNMASGELIAPIKQVLFSGYARLVDAPALLRKAFLDAYGILVLIALPAAIGIGVTADYYVPLLLGPNWGDAVPLIEILVFSSGLRTLGTQVRPVYLALNRPHLGAYASIGSAIVFLPMLLFALLKYGIMGAAVAQVIAEVATLAGSLYLMYRLLGLRPSELLIVSWRSMIACGLMMLAVSALKSFVSATEPEFVVQLAHLALAVLIGFVVYIVVILSLWLLCGRPQDSAESYVLNYLAQCLHRRRAISATATGERS